MSFPLINPYQQFFDSSGSPLANGTIEFRSPSDNSLIDSYPTADDADAQTNANDNPLTLNGSGAAASGLFLEDGVAYKIILKDSDGATVASHDDVRCPFDSDPGDVARYGADPSGAASSTTAFTNCISANGYATGADGTYLVQGLSLGLREKIFGRSRNFILKKNANGAVVTMGNHSKLEDVQIQGDGSTYTGSNVVISSGQNTTDEDDYGWQKIVDCEIHDSASFGVEYDTANRGVFSHIDNCLFSTTGGTNAAIKWPDEPVTDVGNRKVTNCKTVNCDLVNVGAAENGLITGNTISGANNILFPSGTANSASKIIITNNRFAGTGDLQIRGGNHIVSNNVSAVNIELLSGAVNNTLRNNNFASSKGHVDSSSEINYIWDDIRSTYTPTFSGDGGSEAFGNSDVRGEYWREGEWVVYKLYIVWGSTANYGGANWEFTLPVQLESGITTWYAGAAFFNNQPGVAMVDGPNDRVLLYHGTTTGRVGATAPLTWATGNVLSFEVKYRL